MAVSEPLDDAELTKFGIGFADDGFHPYDPSERWWNESWFWDFYDAEGTNAGHCRLGLIPNQQRVWLWLYVFRRHPAYGDEWLAIEQPFCDTSHLRVPTLALDQVGLSFAYDIVSPLRRGRLRVSGAARVVSGRRAGRVVPVSIDVDVAAAGAAHSTGAGDQDGHRSDSYDARRFEQPITVTVTQDVDGEHLTYEGRGERDHSWGPRLWLLEWSFLVLNGAGVRLQCVEVRFPGDGTIEVGYLLRDGEPARDLKTVALEVTRDADLAVGASGRCSVTADDGTTLSFTYDTISAHEMDLSHVLEPAPAASTYRRHLIRAVPDGGGAPLIGWLEDHVMTIEATP